MRMRTLVLLATFAILACSPSSPLDPVGEGEGEGEGDVREPSAGEGEGEGVGEGEGEGEGEGDDPPPPGPCGEVDSFGECDGNTLLYCVDEGTPNETPVALDCGDLYPGQPAACGYLQNAGFYDCILPPGDNCVFESAGGGIIFGFCGGNEGGCLTNFETGETACTTNLGTCDDVPSCIANVLIAQCNQGQPVAIQCSDGSVCQDDACEGVEVGGACVDGVMNCGPGLVCRSGRCG